MGAEVVKLELPDGSDALRGLAPVQGRHALFWKMANRGKRGISLDVRKPEGRELFLRLLPQLRRAGGELPHRHAGPLGAGPGDAARAPTRA